ncbi:MAG: hypothetical protein AB1405_08390 [Bdellovibrionota bacterium]
MSDETQQSADQLRREREAWLATLIIERKEEVLFELDMLLRGLDRFFNLDNLFLSDREQILSRNFREELEIVSELLRRLLALAQLLLDEADKSAFHFQKYVETHVADDLVRDALASRSFSQESPRESLFFLFDSLGHTQTIAEALLARPGAMPYPVFNAIGTIIRRSIALNRYFNPLQSFSFSAAYDRVSNPAITRIVLRVEHSILRRRLSFIFLSFFRLLRYLQFVNPRSRDVGYLKSCVLIFSLVRSDARALLPYLEHGFKDRLFDFEGNLEPDERMEIVTAELNDQAHRLSAELDHLTYQMTMELKKISAEELSHALQANRVFQLRAVVESTHGLLFHFFQQAIVTLARVFDAEASGKDIFPNFEPPAQRSRRLLEDLLALLDLIRHFEDRLNDTDRQDRAAVAGSYLMSLRKFFDYFRNESLYLLRFQDIREFGEFFRHVHDLSVAALQKPDLRDDFLARTKSFQIFLGATTTQLRQREDLQGIDPSNTRVENLLKSFLPKGTTNEGGGQWQAG